MDSGLKVICFVVNSRANYARIKSTIIAAKKNKKFITYVIVGASGLLFNYGEVDRILVEDGIDVDFRVFSVVAGDSPESMAKTTGLAIIELSSIFAKIKPDFVVSVADRYETLATVIAASYMNIAVIHTQGGEISGSIDESVRHACTKLSHLHFPATEKAVEVVRQLGENPESVFLTGCPSIDIAKSAKPRPTEEILKKYRGVGYKIDPLNKYLLVSQHAVTTTFTKSRDQILQTLIAIKDVDIQTIWLWPNIDSGSDSISKAIREFRERNRDCKIAFYRNFSAEDYVNVLRNASCIVGNSSSGIREAAFLGTPSVNIGNRQQGREHAGNVLFTDHDSNQIELCIKTQLNNGRYESSNLFGTGDAGEKMISIIENFTPQIQKTFFGTKN
jgi:UDP-hydrolysing UDP-N-acetyl-D-glucosamine 2-epimerase